jgi:hypothetical protein
VLTSAAADCRTSGYVSATEGELARINFALDELIAARTELRAVAEGVGWPAESI